MVYIARSLRILFGLKAANVFLREEKIHLIIHIAFKCIKRGSFENVFEILASTECVKIKAMI